MWRVSVRVFVTGATGYIGGSVAVRLVEAGHHVRGMIRDPDRRDALARLGVEPVAGSLDDAGLLEEEARLADAVVNAADSDHRSAVEALLSGLGGSGKPFLHTSGSSVVGDDACGEASESVFGEEVYDQGTSWRPAGEKAARVAIDQSVLDAAGRGVRSVVLCNSLIYGHGRALKRDSVQIPALAHQGQASGVIRHVGSGRNIWSTVHIDDVTDLYALALEGAPAGSFFFVENGEASFAAIAAALARALGLRGPQVWDLDAAVDEWGYERAVFALGSNSRVRARRARRVLGWQPRHGSVLDWIATEMPGTG